MTCHIELFIPSNALDMPAAEYSSLSPSTSTSTHVSDASLPQNSRMDDQQFVTTFFCRAKYDYQSADDASLSFRRGDIVEVLTRLDTGWWDGLLGEERGWFPPLILFLPPSPLPPNPPSPVVPAWLNPGYITTTAHGLMQTQIHPLGTGTAWMNSL